MTVRPIPVIRVATSEDEPAIEACVQKAYAPYLDRMPTPPAPMLDDYGALIADAVAYVAEIDDRLLGLIVMWAEQDHLYVDNIAVDPVSQGMGVGSSLLGLATDTARAAGLDEVRLYTNEVMTENLDFYPRRGFVETHRGVEAGYRRVYFTLPVQWNA